MISTSVSGVPRRASTQARAGTFFASTQAIHASSIFALSRMPVIQMVALRMRDLLLPASASNLSILARISAVCPFMSFLRSSAVRPAR